MAAESKCQFVTLTAVDAIGDEHAIVIRCAAIIAVEEDDMVPGLGCWVSFGTQRVQVEEIYSQVARTMTGGEKPIECEQYT